MIGLARYAKAWGEGRCSQVTGFERGITGPLMIMSKVIKELGFLFLLA